jgi:hypothetical protein
MRFLLNAYLGFQKNEEKTKKQREWCSTQGKNMLPRAAKSYTDIPTERQEYER